MLRPPLQNGADQGDFTDGYGQCWDIKSSPGQTPSTLQGAGRPIPSLQAIRTAGLAGRGRIWSAAMHYAHFSQSAAQAWLAWGHWAYGELQPSITG